MHGFFVIIKNIKRYATDFPRVWRCENIVIHVRSNSNGGEDWPTPRNDG